MDIKTFLEDWIKASNAFDTERYLEKYREDAILDDLSVGKTFIGHTGIRDYFTRYFIGYRTQIKLIRLFINGNQAYLEVKFTGEFPEGKIGGTFDFKIREGKIATVTADLI